MSLNFEFKGANGTFTIDHKGIVYGSFIHSDCLEDIDEAISQIL